MKFEEVLPYIRKKEWVQRANGAMKITLSPCGSEFINDDRRAIDLNDVDTFDSLFHCDDWVVTKKPIRVADYLVEVKHSAHVINKIWGRESVKMESVPYYIKQTHPIGQQPEGSVLVPGSERDSDEQ